MKHNTPRLIDIPYAPVRLFLYIGDVEAFDAKVRHKYTEWEGSPDADGLHFQNHIYIDSIKPEDREILFHELQHFLDWLFEYMQITGEPEFKACIAAHVHEQILLMIEKKRTKEKT